MASYGAIKDRRIRTIPFSSNRGSVWALQVVFFGDGREVYLNHLGEELTLKHDEIIETGAGSQSEALGRVIPWLTREIIEMRKEGK